MLVTRCESVQDHAAQDNVKTSAKQNFYLWKQRNEELSIQRDIDII